MKVRLIATKAMRRLKPGDAFEEKPRIAKLLLALGRAVEAPEVEAPAKEAEAPAAAEAPAKEVDPVPSPTAIGAVTTDDVEPKPKRAYKRRDMGAEH